MTAVTHLLNQLQRPRIVVMLRKMVDNSGEVVVEPDAVGVDWQGHENRVSVIVVALRRLPLDVGIVTNVCRGNRQN